MTYTSPEFLDAHVRYRRERLASEWQAGHSGYVANAFLARARATVNAVSGLRAPARRRQRHA